ncbi:hypothetical protein JCGZ_27053 [Jatropha curcas]|uniref:Cytochrome P450 n=1 Tax=Jatropha curcas TaxID=180498 RepID=A0A067LG26_JATCU|nr:hypothetical protein JCGZ_27053 [Jatropha curcas]
MQEMFFGGTETTSGTIEWVMTELFRNPAESMKKVKEELNRVIGSNRKVEESDIDELPYLDYRTQTLWVLEAWEDPLCFKPERFIGSNIDYRGQNFELLPFGAGRRICVGIPMAHRVVHFAVASLLHCFDWELDSNSAAENLDVKERMGITVRKLKPVKAIPKKKMMAE